MLNDRYTVCVERTFGDDNFLVIDTRPGFFPQPMLCVVARCAAFEDAEKITMLLNVSESTEKEPDA